jgi:hypothetical protein
MLSQSMYTSYSRLKSHLMVAACFACDRRAEHPGLVIGYLISIGFGSLHWGFFT